MKCLLLLLGLIVLCNCFPLSAQVQNKANHTSKSYALIIGITNYQNPAIPALQFADKDALQFSTWLQSKSGGSIPQKNIRLLQNNEATIAAIYNALDWLKEQCKENDNAYIYFAGHGDVETKNNYSKGYLLAYNSPQNNYANNAIRIEDFNNTSISLTTKNKANVIIISDACHSGKLAGDFFKGKQLVASELNKVLNNQVRLASCKEDELAAEGSNWGGGRGVFSYYLILGLQGLSTIQADSSIHLSDLSMYLNKALATDKVLIQNQHIQNPVSDGNPNFKMAIADAATLTAAQASINKISTNKTNIPIGLMALQPLEPQPIDYFFSTISSLPIESILNFDNYETLNDTTFPMKMVEDCIEYQKQLNAQKDTTNIPDAAVDAYQVFNLDSLRLLADELQQNSATQNRFVEKFIETVHDKGQDMINAYLKGDLSELERRQYYYSGKRDYLKHISMLKVALNVVPENHQLAHILWVHYYYLSGLIYRLQMATHANTDSLLNLSFSYENKALKLEPYSAYIANEMGNLYVHKNKYDSANYYYNLASVISPTWAIPWSNKIRMNLAFNKLDLAEKDIHTADSLQPNLAFALINAGLVMEKKENLLAAEFYYLKAIKENDIHYLPYERLSDIYLKKCDYAKANYFFHETETRKKDFTINFENFKHGVEAVYPVVFLPHFDNIDCSAKIPQNANSALYQLLYRTIKKIDSSDNDEKIIDTLKQIIHQKPDIPLATHFLGMCYYRNGNMELAEKMLDKAVSTYLLDDRLLQKITKDIIGNKDTCKFKSFLNLQYDILEDRYLLSDIFEKKKNYKEALKQYGLISILENKRQMEQAGYKNYDKLKKTFAGSNEYLEAYLTQATETPIMMAGAIKLARLLEKMGDYKTAEQTLLRQVALNRKAGDERQIAINEKKPGWDLNGAGTTNFYWEDINSYLESEVYNFYQKILSLYPRDSYWQGNAGLFLYGRLKMAFDQVPVKQYQMFYKYVNNNPYPWKNPAGIYDNYFSDIPGTKSQLIIQSTTYDPLKKSIEAIEQSVHFSGNLKPDIEKAKALAELYSWTGNVETSIQWYQQALALNPSDWKWRSQYSRYLAACAFLPSALAQLEILQQQKKATQTQKIQLADWRYLSGKNDGANNLLQAIRPINTEEKRIVLLLKARNAALLGNNVTALRYYKDSIPELKINASDDYEIKEEKQVKNRDRLYAIAKQNALLKNYDVAFKIIKQTLDAGFQFEYLLKYDEAWAHFRNTAPWQQLLSGYKFELDTPNTDINPIIYRIPKMANRKK